MNNLGHILCGFHAVETALESGRGRLAEIVHDSAKHNPRLNRLLATAHAHGIRLQRSDKQSLDQLSGGLRHQGVVGLLARAPSLGLAELKSWLSEERDDPLLMILDGLEDPRNVGACLRSAAAAGVDAVIMPAKAGAGLTPAALRVAEGGVHQLSIFEVNNWAQVLKLIQERGFWIVGTSERAEQPIYGFDLTGPLAWVFGSEATGLRSLTEKHCDAVVKIPAASEFSSLNVAVAAGIALFETRRQRALLSG